jgi:hypothetical protein
MQLSRLGEIAALSPVEKPILTAEQIAGHETQWQNDNLENYPYLLINEVTDAEGNPIPAGPIGYTKPPQVPQSLALLLQLTEQDMTDILGNQQAGEEIQPNISGKAIELIQNRLDMQSFIYMSNFAKAVRRCGEVWLSMAKDVYVEKNRKMKAINEEGDNTIIEIGKPMLSDSGNIEMTFDLSDAELDVSVDVGPSSSSKRAASVRALTGMLQYAQDPETVSVITLMSLLNMEGEGINEVRQYARRKLIKLGVIEPNEQEKQDLAEEAKNMPPDANQEYLKSAAMNEQAKAVKAQADAELTAAKVEETRAKTAETVAGIDREDQKKAVETAKAIHEAMGQTIQPNEMDEQ